MASLKFKYVMVDRQTRRRVGLPEDFPGKKKLRNDSEPDLVYRVRRPPENAFVTQVVVQFSDTDMNGHTNNSSYIRICVDIFAQACHAGRIDWVQGSSTDYRVVRMSMYYAKECNEGDILTVFLWSERNSQVSFLFRLGSVDIYHSKFEFQNRSRLLSAKL